MSEQWRDIKGFEGAYQISSLGRVRGLDRMQAGRWGQPVRCPGRIMSPSAQSSGHISVILMRDGKRTYHYIHRLVAIAFIPNPSNEPWVLHWDDDPSNNVVENLRWGSPKHNAEDREARGRGRYSKGKERQ